MTDRVSERRRAAQLARHYREQEGLTIAEIARRLGRAEGTVKAYLYDPVGEKAREVKARYRGVCRGCGASTSARNGKGDAYAYCNCCRPGAIARQWTRGRVREAIRAWQAHYGTAPSSYDWSRTHARRRGGEALIGHHRCCLDQPPGEGLQRLPPFGGPRQDQPLPAGGEVPT
jgi:AraC-like DNA-binding protein